MKDRKIKTIIAPSLTLKLLTISLLFASVPGFLGLFIEDPNKRGRVYQEVIYNVMPHWAWSALWGILTILIVYYCITSNYLSFLTSNILFIFLGLSHGLMRLYGKYIADLPVSILSSGVWFALVFVSIVVLFTDTKTYHRQ